MFNPESLRKHLANLSDEELLEVNPGDLADEAIAIYQAEMQERGISWESSGEELVEAPPGSPVRPEGELVPVARYETFEEARYAMTLLRQNDIPVWIAGKPTGGRVMIDPNAPIDLVTTPDRLEEAQLALSTEISDEELARQAEEFELDEDTSR